MNHRLLITLGLGLLTTGCIERTLIVQSDPPGAIVFLDEERIDGPDGEPKLTPVEIPFQFYGTRQVLLRREGYRSHQEMVELRPPVYDTFPLDFFAEILIPYTFENIQKVTIQLEPTPAPSEARRETLLDAAEAFRRKIPGDEETVSGNGD